MRVGTDDPGANSRTDDSLGRICTNRSVTRCIQEMNGQPGFEPSRKKVRYGFEGELNFGLIRIVDVIVLLVSCADQQWFPRQLRAGVNELTDVACCICYQEDCIA